MVIRALPLAVLGIALALIGLSQRFDGGVDRAFALTNCQTSNEGMNGNEQEMLNLMNAARAAEGVGLLTVSPGLMRSAAWKSEDAVGQPLSHSDSTGRAWDRRIQDCGYPQPLSENVGFGSSSALAMFDAFMRSSGHRANILRANARVVGIGQYQTQWTIDFGVYDDSGDPPPTPTPTTAASTATPGPTRTPTAAPTATPTATPTRPLLPPGRAVAPMLASAAD